MSRLNTKQRRARFRNSKTGKFVTDLLKSYGDTFNGTDVYSVSWRYPLYRGNRFIR